MKTARDPRVSARQQAEARAAIAPFLDDRLPRVLFAGRYEGEDMLVTECPSMTTLADAVAENGQAVLGTWKDVVTRLGQVWDESARPGFDHALATRNHALRWRRGADGLRFTAQDMRLPEASLRHVVVNDVDHGSLESILERLANVPSPTVHVACQGDPQPRNVLVDTVGRWHLVDWEWAGRYQDWRMLTSHLIGWWHVENLLNRSRGHASATRTAVSLSYEPPRTATLFPWATSVMEVFQRMSGPGHRDRDLKALAYHTAMLLIREIPRTIADGCHHLFAPLLGEAIRLVDSTHAHALHPLLSPFLDAQQGQGGPA